MFFDFNKFQAHPHVILGFDAKEAGFIVACHITDAGGLEAVVYVLPNFPHECELWGQKIRPGTPAMLSQSWPKDEHERAAKETAQAIQELLGPDVVILPVEVQWEKKEVDIPAFLHEVKKAKEKAKQAYDRARMN